MNSKVIKIVSRK